MDILLDSAFSSSAKEAIRVFRSYFLSRAHSVTTHDRARLGSFVIKMNYVTKMMVIYADLSLNILRFECEVT